MVSDILTLVCWLPVQAMEEEMAELTATGAPAADAPVSREDSAHDMTQGPNGSSREVGN